MNFINLRAPGHRDVPRPHRAAANLAVSVEARHGHNTVPRGKAQQLHGHNTCLEDATVPPARCQGALLRVPVGCASPRAGAGEAELEQVVQSVPYVWVGVSIDIYYAC